VTREYSGSFPPAALYCMEASFSCWAGLSVTARLMNQSARRRDCAVLTVGGSFPVGDSRQIL
jgi:hypothetical protein